MTFLASHVIQNQLKLFQFMLLRVLFFHLKTNFMNVSGEQFYEENLIDHNYIETHKKSAMPRAFLLSKGISSL